MDIPGSTLGLASKSRVECRNDAPSQGIESLFVQTCKPGTDRGYDLQARTVPFSLSSRILRFYSHEAHESTARSGFGASPSPTLDAVSQTQQSAWTQILPGKPRALFFAGSLSSPLFNTRNYNGLTRCCIRPRQTFWDYKQDGARGLHSSRNSGQHRAQQKHPLHGVYLQPDASYRVFQTPTLHTPPHCRSP